MILAIDPGPIESAWCTYRHARLPDVWQPQEWRKEENATVIHRIQTFRGCLGPGRVCIEMVACYGMPVGAEVFETCLWIGRFAQVAGVVERITRNQVKHHLCHSSKANDATVRQAILDRFGGKERAIGKKANPGPLYGLSGDGWAALALAITAAETSARYEWPKVTP